MKLWIAYTVDHVGEVQIKQFYHDGHPIKCRFSAVKTQEGGNAEYQKGEDRWVVAYKSHPELAYQVFQLVEIGLLGLGNLPSLESLSAERQQREAEEAEAKERAAAEKAEARAKAKAEKDEPAAVVAAA